MSAAAPRFRPSRAAAVGSVLAAAALLLTAAAPFRVTPPPEGRGLDPFYVKHVDVHGLPVVGSARVSEFALLEAAYLVDRMLGARPEVLRAMADQRVRLAVMAYSERTTDVPEHRDLTPAKYWDRRARGLGATRARPAVSCAEENLLGYPGDPYAAENILVHEFAHAVHEMGLNRTDPTFDGRLKKAYEAALAQGLWKKTYAATNRNEYWAEGVQSWFDTNRPPDAVHNDVDTREELKAYDPGLAALVAEVYGDTPWRYARSARRPEPERAHLRGYDPAKAPRFSWDALLRDR